MNLPEHGADAHPYYPERPPRLAKRGPQYPCPSCGRETTPEHLASVGVCRACDDRAAR